MKNKCFAVAVFHFPTCTHEILFVGGEDQNKALKNALVEFVESWIADAILSEDELHEVLYYEGTIYNLIDHLSNYQLYCAVQELVEQLHHQQEIVN